MMMRTKILILLMLLTAVTATARTHLYRGNSTYTSDILYTINGTIPVPVLIMLM